MKKLYKVKTIMGRINGGKMKILMLTLFLSVVVGCLDQRSNCPIEIISPYRDVCERSIYLNCGVNYFNCKSGNQYKCSTSFVTKKVCE